MGDPARQYSEPSRTGDTDLFEATVGSIGCRPASPYDRGLDPMEGMDWSEYLAATRRSTPRTRFRIVDTAQAFEDNLPKVLAWAQIA